MSGRDPRAAVRRDTLQALGCAMAVALLVVVALVVYLWTL